MSYSESAKNWVTTIAIVLGGIWAVWEFYLKTPLRTTGDQVATARLALRVNSAIRVDAVLSRAVIREWRQQCSENSAGNADVQVDTRVVLTVQSAMDVPVKLSLKDLVTRPLGQSATRTVGFVSSKGLSPSIGDPTSYQLHWQDFATGKADRKIDPDERNAFFFAGFVPYQLRCPDGENGAPTTEYIIGFRFELESVDGRLKSSTHSAMTLCRFAPDVSLSCTAQESGNGQQTGLGLARGQNAQISDGGLIYDPPVR